MNRRHVAKLAHQFGVYDLADDQATFGMSPIQPFFRCEAVGFVFQQDIKENVRVQRRDQALSS